MLTHLHVHQLWIGAFIYMFFSIMRITFRTLQTKDNLYQLKRDGGENNTTRSITERLNYFIKTSNDVHNGKM